MRIFIAPGGGTVLSVVEGAIALANKFQDEVKTKVNELELMVQPGSHPVDIMTIYDLKCKIRRLQLGHRDEE